MKLYRWYLNSIMEGNEVCIDNYYLTDENKCKELVDQQPESKYYEMTLDELLDLDCELVGEGKNNEELKGCIIENAGQKYQYINSFSMNSEGKMVAFVPVEDAKKYTKICAECGLVMHEEYEEMEYGVDDSVFCEFCKENVCKHCGKYIQDEHRKDTITYNEDGDYSYETNYHLECFKKAVNEGEIEVNTELTDWVELVMAM